MTSHPATICFPFVGDSIGGSHISALILIQHLDRLRFSPLTVVHERGPLTEHLERNNIAYELLPLTAYVGRHSNIWRQIAAVADTFGPIRRFLRRKDVAIVHTQDARMHLTWTLPARAAGTAVVWHQRTRFSPSRIAWAMAHFASRMICISRFVLTSLPESVTNCAAVISNPVVAFPGPLAAGDHRNELCGRAGVASDAVIIATVGNLREIKRPMLFVEAAAHIQRLIDRPVVFAVFGEDREGFIPRMRKHAEREGFGDRLLFLGFRDPIEPWIAACDVILAPSVGDAFGRSLVEAMLSGVPVVAADAGGHSEIIDHGENGFLVPSDDAQAMAAACVTLLQDPKMAAATTARARRDAETRFAVADHVQAVMAIYQAALSSPAMTGTGIAIVIADLGGGGAQRVATTLAHAWSDEGREITLITLSANQRDVFPTPPGVRRLALDLIGCSSSPLGGLIANLRRIRALRRALVESGAAVVIGFVGATNVLTILAGLGLGKRIIVSERNDPARQSLGVMWNLLRRLSYPLASCVTANSRSALRSLAAYVPQAKLALTPNAVLTPNGDPAPNESGRFMLAVGRLHPQKGLDVLLDALARSDARRTGWRLKLLGDGALRQTLQDQAVALGVADLVDWMGYVSDPFAWYAAADAFVLPSRYEGMPNALLEAMTMGLPVIVTDACPGPMEYVEPGVSGVVIPVEDPDALARAMDRIMGDSDFANRLGSEGRCRVRADTALPRVMAAWDQALGQGRRTAYEETAR